MTNKVALVFHMNLDHSRLPRGDSIELINTTLEEMLKSVRVPINLSSTARDWELVQELNPSLINWIKENRFLTILDGTYSHAIPFHFPSFVGVQFELGHKVHTNIFGDSSNMNQLSQYGFVPEFAFDSLLLCSMERYWKGNIASDSTLIVDKTNSNSSGPPYDYRNLNIMAVNDGEGKIHPINVARKIGDKRTYHKLFRGVNEPQNFTDRLWSKARDTDAPFITYLHDFETPLLNMVDYQGQIIKRTDVWHQLMAHLPELGLEFISLDSNAFEKSAEYSSKSDVGYIVLPRRMDKWLADQSAINLYEAIKRISQEKDVRDQYHLRTLLTIMGSDVFVNPSHLNGLKNAGRIYDAQSKKFVMVDAIFRVSDTTRLLERMHLLTCLQKGVPVNYGIDSFPQAQQTYFNALHAIFSRKT